MWELWFVDAAASKKLLPLIPVILYFFPRRDLFFPLKFRTVLPILNFAVGGGGRRGFSLFWPNQEDGVMGWLCGDLEGFFDAEGVLVIRDVREGRRVRWFVGKRVVGGASTRMGARVKGRC